MVAVVQPVAFIIRLPLAEGSELLSENLVLDPGSGYEPVGSSAMSLDLSCRPYRRGCSVVQFPSLLDLGLQFPHIRHLQLRDVAVHAAPNPSTYALDRLPRFSLLESLSIVLFSTRLSRAAAVTKSLVSIFPHMPRLRSLKVYAPSMRPYVEPDSLVQYPDPPFSLERFICVSALSVRVGARIVSRSCDTLNELKVNLSSDTDALLIAALESAAPRLRRLDLGLGLSADSIPWPRVRSVIGALARLERLHLESPQTLEEALDLLTGLESMRELSLWCMLYSREQSSAHAAEQLVSYVTRTPSLRSVTLYGYRVGDEERAALLEHCRARRIRCSITD